MSSQEVMRKYLESIGQLVGGPNGPELEGGAKVELTEKDSEHLRKLVESQSASNRRVLWFSLAMILVVFLLAVGSAFRLGSSIPTILSILGVGGGFETGLLMWVLHLWSEYNRFGFLLIMSYRLSPEDLAKAVIALFQSDRAKKSGVRSRRVVKAVSSQ